MGGKPLEEWLTSIETLHSFDGQLLALAQKYGCEDKLDLLLKYEEAMKFKADVEKLFANTGTHSVDELIAYVGRLAEADPGRDFIVDPLVEAELHDLAPVHHGVGADIPPVQHADMQTQADAAPAPQPV